MPQSAFSLRARGLHRCGACGKRPLIQHSVNCSAVPGLRQTRPELENKGSHLMEDNTRYCEEMVRNRRALHKRPEEGWTEFETTYFVVKRLRALGLQVAVGKANINEAEVLGRDPQLVKDGMMRALKQGVPQAFLDETEGYTGAVAVLDTGRPGPTTAFRADMDCVLVRESDDESHAPTKLGFASERPGFMHACGHDAHTAVGLEVARWLVDHKDELCGRFKLIFQPAEEGVRGARAMTAAGVVDDVDYFLGGHVGGLAALGEIGVMDGGFLASTKFDVDIEGQPAHAGNAPQLGHNALMAACAAQGIPRNGDGATRVSVGTLHAGEGRNVIPAHARLQMEVRGETEEINAYMRDYVYDIFAGVDKAYRVKSTVTMAGESTTLLQSPDLYEKVEEVMRTVPGTKLLPRIHAPSGSEDCAAFIRRVIQKGGQAAFILWGCNHHGHHRPNFDIQDETSMPGAFCVYTGFARKMNGIKA